MDALTVEVEANWFLRNRTRENQNINTLPPKNRELHLPTFLSSAAVKYSTVVGLQASDIIDPTAWRLHP